MNLESQKNETGKEDLIRKDYLIGILAGFLIGLMFMPVLNTIKPELFLKLKLAVIPFFLVGTPFGLTIAHLISKKISFIWQLGKFVVTGILNVLVDFGTLSILTIVIERYFYTNSTDSFIDFGFFTLTFYSLYKSISFVIANINSYFWNKHWTFNKNEDKKSEFFQFFTVSIIGFIINVTVASFVFNYSTIFTGMDTNQWGLIGAAAGSIIGLVWNFLGYKFIVFKK
jgi:putative flippase GtrA